MSGALNLRFQFCGWTLRWHRNVHKVTVKRRIDILPSQLLIAVPQFRNALLHLARLIEELKQVRWLPQDPLRTYTLLDFQTALLEKKRTAQASLDRFLHCRAAVLNTVKDKSYQACQDLQMEVENVKLYQSSQSLHLQVSYLRKLQKELSQAEQAIQWLGNLASLADHMTVQNLVTISKGEITAFLNNVLNVRIKVLIVNFELHVRLMYFSCFTNAHHLKNFQRKREEQSGLFQVEIIFGTDGQLSVFPPLHLFQEVLHEAVLSVEDSILQVRSHRAPDGRIKQYMHRVLIIPILLSNL
nr:dynein heavy chain domain-containing protein 1-like [Danio rerio]|eukprot:XP_021335663.1 dynein heavy chain domain-containing protein 1-like [Danio rerio]